MSATQTLGSASLVALLVAQAVPARAEPAKATPGQPASEVQVDDGEAQPPGETAPTPPPPAPPPPKKPPTGRFQVGAGYSPDDKFIASASIAQDDLFGTGQHLALTARISAREQLFLAGWDAPHLDGSALTLHTQMFARQDQLPGFRRSAAGGSISLSAPLADHLTGFAGYRLEQVATTYDDPIAARSVPGGATAVSRDGLIASLYGGLAYSTLDQPFLPTRGVAVGAKIQVADPRWGSEIQMTRADSWASVHHALGPFIVHVGGSLSTVSSRDPAGVPLSERLHLDGASMLRGYAPGSIGPRDAVTGMSLGGNIEYGAHGELELPVFPQVGISVVGFLDHAGIYDAGGAGSSGTSAGFGLIWRSPIGPLRFDWAVPLDGGRPQFLFSFGGASF